MEVRVAEIHRYPLRSEGFEEPLFPIADFRRTVAEHLLRASWLSQASEFEGRGGQDARAWLEPVELEKRCGRARIAWTIGRRRCTRKKRQVVETLARWREVRAWRDEEWATNRAVVRVLLSDGAVVDLAREFSGEWFLMGVAD
jgi:hypothetical protein